MDFVSAATGPSLMPDEPSYILLETSSGSDDPNADRERYSHASLVAPDTSRLERFLQPYIESEDILTAVVSYSKAQELVCCNRNYPMTCYVVFMEYSRNFATLSAIYSVAANDVQLQI